MIARRITRVGCVLAMALATVLATALPASASGRTKGTVSLATVLAADGSGFDRNGNDFDITDKAVSAVLGKKPDSAVAVLADGTVSLTAFLPTDRAFRKLAKDLTGTTYKTEAQVFAALAGTLGIDTIENVLLYHVVPGATVTYRQALKSNGAVLSTALPGKSVKVKVVWRYFVSLKDNDPDASNPYVVKANLNKGNRQIAHGINRVLRPVDL